jgi:hypothetical protein
MIKQANAPGVTHGKSAAGSNFRLCCTVSAMRATAFRNQSGTS